MDGLDGVDPSQFEYTSCYCEENVWKLLNDHAPRLSASGKSEDDQQLSRWAACFISNPRKQVAVFRQKAGRGDVGAIVWDYHVVAIGPHPDPALKGSLYVYDFDSTLLFPCPIELYFALALPRDVVAERYQPMFRVVPRGLFLRHFSSDRSHMIKDDKYLSPPPAYDPILAGGLLRLCTN